MATPFMRFARQAGLPIIGDPVLNEYIDDLGSRLLTNADSCVSPLPSSSSTRSQHQRGCLPRWPGRIPASSSTAGEAERGPSLCPAHEIAHVTQRHIARHMGGAQASSSRHDPGWSGGLHRARGDQPLLAGIAALQTTLGLSMQSAINYTPGPRIRGGSHPGMKTLV